MADRSRRGGPGRTTEECAGVRCRLRPPPLVGHPACVDPDHQTGTGFTITPGTPHDDEQIETTGDRAAKKILDDTIAALGLVGVELMAKAGTPGEMICEVAASIDAHVIVMGTNGRSGFRRAMVGSTSDHVVRHAVCPVLVQGAG